jgi:regulator of CtrA degradation
MNNKTRNGDGDKRDAVTVDFGARFAASEMFVKVFREGMSLVEETASYLDGPGRRESRELSRAASLAYATESMRLTTRLMQLASWLLLQRAVKDGEMTTAEARDEKYKINLVELGETEALPGEERLPDGLQDLISRSLRLHGRIMRLDEMLHGGGTDDVAPAGNPVSDQMSQIQAAFGTQRRNDRG